MKLDLITRTMVRVTAAAALTALAALAVIGCLWLGAAL